jgi:hypothetical protein
MAISYEKDLLPFAARFPSGRPPLAVTGIVRDGLSLRYRNTHSTLAPGLDLP